MTYICNVVDIRSSFDFEFHQIRYFRIEETITFYQYEDRDMRQRNQLISNNCYK